MTMTTTTLQPNPKKRFGWVVKENTLDQIAPHIFFQHETGATIAEMKLRLATSGVCGAGSLPRPSPSPRVEARQRARVRGNITPRRVAAEATVLSSLNEFDVARGDREEGHQQSTGSGSTLTQTFLFVVAGVLHDSASTASICEIESFRDIFFDLPCEPAQTSKAQGFSFSTLQSKIGLRSKWLEVAKRLDLHKESYVSKRVLLAVLGYDSSSRRWQVLRDTPGGKGGGGGGGEVCAMLLAAVLAMWAHYAPSLTVCCVDMLLRGVKCEDLSEHVKELHALREYITQIGQEHKRGDVEYALVSEYIEKSCSTLCGFMHEE